MLRSPLVRFLILGALLFGVDRLALRPGEAPSPPVVQVLRSEIDARVAAYRRQVRRPLEAAEAQAIERQTVDDALWLEQARALGLDETDPVVRRRLALNMQFLEDDADATEDERVERAFELGLDRSDTVVRRRLIDRVQALVRAGVRARIPDEAGLRAYYEEHAERWREPDLLDLTHVYLSRDRRGESCIAEAEQLLAELEREDVPPDEAPLRGDPFLSGHRLTRATPNRIVARLGPDFAEGVADAPTGRWVGPVESAFGTHLVWIHERIPSHIPSFESIRQRVESDWVEDESREALRRQIDRRRALVEIRIVDDTGRRADGAHRSGDA